MSGPDQWDMEQPWPPPGPWSFPRIGGETEEESDLDVSPSSSHYSPVPDGGAQVRAACVLPGAGDGKCLRASRGSLMPSHSSGSIFREKGDDHACIPDLHVHAHLSPHRGWLPLTFARGSSSPSLLLSALELWGPAQVYNIDPLSFGACFHPSLYYELQLLCAQLIGTESDCTSIIVHRVLT